MNVLENKNFLPVLKIRSFQIVTLMWKMANQAQNLNLLLQCKGGFVWRLVKKKNISLEVAYCGVANMKSIQSARRLTVRGGSMACSPYDTDTVLSVQASRNHVHPHVCFLWTLVLQNQNLRHLHTFTLHDSMNHGKAMY
jgi:hypothetical protein